MSKKNTSKNAVAKKPFSKSAAKPSKKPVTKKTEKKPAKAKAAPKAKPVATEKAEKPAKVSRGAKLCHTPAMIGIGKTLEHKYRDGKPTVTCKVVDNGFKTGDVVHKSLGAAAKAVSGLNWNGMLFWGLAEFPKHKKEAK